MCKVTKVQSKASNTTMLRNIRGGESFHFDSLSLDEAIQEKAIYFVVDKIKDKRATIVNFADGQMMQCDDFHRVCPIIVNIQVVV